MSWVIIKYSVPIQNKAELLDGSLGTEVLGYRHIALTIQTHVFKADLPTAMTQLAPLGYYVTDHPQVSPDPPKLEIYQVVSQAEKYSASPLPFAIERPSGEPAYTGI